MNERNGLALPVNIGYGLMRLMVGLLFACHGMQKNLGWFTPPDRPAEPLSLFLRIGGWIELVCGLLIAIGLLTRPAAFLASGTMAVAYFLFHAKGGFLPIVNHGELAVLYSWVFLFIFLYGGGAISIDAVLKERRSVSKTGE